MYHGVVRNDEDEIVNTMDQDVLLGVSTTVTQADIPYLREAGRLGEYAVVYRVYRNQLGGGFGDQDKHPHAWGVLVYVDTLVARVYSARGQGREWNSLDRLERWLRENGFWYWWTRNDLEPLGGAEAEAEDEEAEVTQPLAPIPAYLPPLGQETVDGGADAEAPLAATPDFPPPAGRGDEDETGGI